MGKGVPEDVELCTGYRYIVKELDENGKVSLSIDFGDGPRTKAQVRQSYKDWCDSWGKTPLKIRLVIVGRKK